MQVRGVIHSWRIFVAYVTHFLTKIKFLSSNSQVVRSTYTTTFKLAQVQHASSGPVTWTR